MVFPILFDRRSQLEGSCSKCANALVKGRRLKGNQIINGINDFFYTR